MADTTGQLTLSTPLLVDNLTIVAVRRLRPLIDEETCIDVLLDLGASLEEIVEVRAGYREESVLDDS